MAIELHADCRGCRRHCCFSHSCSNWGRERITDICNDFSCFTLPFPFKLLRLLSKGCRLDNLLQLLMLYALLFLRRVSKDSMRCVVPPRATPKKKHLDLFPICITCGIDAWPACHLLLGAFSWLCLYNWLSILRLQGYGSFLLRDLPFDAIQFCIYEQLRIGYKAAVSSLQCRVEVHFFEELILLDGFHFSLWLCIMVMLYGMFFRSDALIHSLVAISLTARCFVSSMLLYRRFVTIPCDLVLGVPIMVTSKFYQRGLYDLILCPLNSD